MTKEHLELLLKIIPIQITLTVPFIIVWLNRRQIKRRLGYTTNMVPIVSRNSVVGSGIEIKWHGREIQDASIVFVRFTNLGSVSIEPEHFARPISVKLPGSRKILQVEASEAYQRLLEDLKLFEEAEPTIQAGLYEETIKMPPMLLNPGDTVMVVAVVDGFAGRVEPDCHVMHMRGLEKIGPSGRTRLLSNPYLLVALGAYVTIVLTLIVMAAFVMTHSKPLTVGLTLLVYPLAAWLLYKASKYERMLFS
jgi:hypothetical protein